jgi:RNA polymerase sigma-70 factor (ECF subfamily)
MSSAAVPLPFLSLSPGQSDEVPRRDSVESATRWFERSNAEADAATDPAFVDLIARLRTGDESAFRSLWEQYHVRLANFALRYLGSRDAAADVVQDVFVALWDRHDCIEVRGSLSAYLYGMVRYTVMDLRKHERVVRRHSEITATAYAAAPVVAHNLGADVLAVEEMQQTLHRVVAALPARTREIFLLSREDGLAPSAIASILGIGSQVVYNQLSRALKALHDAFAKDV